MEQIHIISNSTVSPSNTRNLITKRIQLTPFDLPFLGFDYAQRGLVFLKPKPTTDHGLQLKDLKASLSRALDIFPPFAGRLAMVENDDKTSSFFIDCNGAGAQFVHAVAHDVTVADIVDSKYVPDILFSFFLMNKVFNCQGISKPLLGIQVTELVDGIFFGFSLNHAIADGATLWHFVNTWSEISRCSGKITQPLPVLGYKVFDAIDGPIRVPFSFNETVSSDKIFSPPPLLVRVFSFTKDKIARLKVKSNAEMSTTRISSLQAVMAHLWRSTVRSRHLESTDQQVHLMIAVDMRQRWEPPLPEKYFGNAIQVGTVTTTVGELLSNGLGWAALQLNKKLMHVGEESRKKLESWGKRPELPNLDATVSNALFVGSSPRFNMYGNDFGWGRPVAVRAGISTNFDGKIAAFPGAQEGSMDIQICLIPQVLQAVENDAEFMEAVST